jgi:hypothetical protein
VDGNARNKRWVVFGADAAYYVGKFDGKIKFRVVIDRPMYEVVGGDGDTYKTAPRSDGGKLINAIQLSAIGGEANIHKLIVYPMQSI